MKEEKLHGGWYVSYGIDPSWQLVYREYRSDRDLLMEVWRVEDGLFRASILDKIVDYREVDPTWSERRPEGLFGSREEGIAYLMQRLRAQNSDDSEGDQHR
jgi:hypothetical protein